MRNCMVGASLKIRNDANAPMNGADAKSVLALAEPRPRIARMKSKRLAP